MFRNFCLFRYLLANILIMRRFSVQYKRISFVILAKRRNVIGLNSDRLRSEVSILAPRNMFDRIIHVIFNAKMTFENNKCKTQMLILELIETFIEKRSVNTQKRYFF